MKKNAVALPFAVGAFLLFAACGDDVTKTTVNETTGISQLAKGAEFPECDSSAAGEMLYAADSGKVYYCGADGKWETLNGLDGEAGESSVDTVVVRDSLISKDTLILSSVDTLIIRDTVLGLSGENGESCTAEELEDNRGYRIVCGGDSVGVVLNGAKGETGENGEQGERGETGDDGESCTLSDNGAGTVQVICGTSSIDIYKALCNNLPYDPATHFCWNGTTIRELCGGKVYTSGQQCTDGTVTNVAPIIKFEDSKSCGSNSYYASSAFCDERDNQVYTFDTINGKVWMTENLNYDYNVGTAKSLCLDDNCAECGRIYTWAAAMDSAGVINSNGFGRNCGDGIECSPKGNVQGVCPKGWHLPSLTEWEELEGDLTKFKILFITEAKTTYAQFWHSTEATVSISPTQATYYAWVRQYNATTSYSQPTISADIAYVGDHSDKKGNYNSVRCVKD